MEELIYLNEKLNIQNLYEFMPEYEVGFKIKTVYNDDSIETFNNITEFRYNYIGYQNKMKCSFESSIHHRVAIKDIKDIKKIEIFNAVKKEDNFV